MKKNYQQTFFGAVPVAAAIFLTSFACQSGGISSTSTHGELTPTTSAPLSAITDTAAGIFWGMPAGWTEGTVNEMRVATYLMEPAAGDTEQAECRINFFGADQGGDIEQNIQRWQGQFLIDIATQEKATPSVTTSAVAGVPLTIVELSGVFAGGMAPMAQSAAPKPGFRMFAAIATAPEGTVFFKLTGPSASVLANRERFRSMLGSLKSIGS